MYEVPINPLNKQGLFGLMWCRPVGLAFDARGRLYVSSDASGEIFRVRYTNGSSNSTTNSTSSGSRDSLSAFLFAFVIGVILLGMN